jgi:hypothetical protein
MPRTFSLASLMLLVTAAAIVCGLVANFPNAAILCGVVALYAMPALIITGVFTWLARDRYGVGCGGLLGAWCSILLIPAINHPSSFVDELVFCAGFPVLGALVVGGCALFVDRNTKRE